MGKMEKLVPGCPEWIKMTELFGQCIDPTPLFDYFGITEQEFLEYKKKIKILKKL